MSGQQDNSGVCPKQNEVARESEALQGRGVETTAEAGDRSG